MIWFAAILLTLLALLGLTVPWWSPRFMRPRGLARRSANISLYRERLEQLPRDVAAGVVSAEAAEELKGELASRLVKDAEEGEAVVQGSSAPWLPFAAAAVLALFGGAWYIADGSWRTQALVDLARTDPEAARQVAVGQMIQKLEEHLKNEPHDADSWIWLGRTYRGRERYADAAHAFEQASALKGDQDPDVLTEWGEALAFMQGRSLVGEPAEKFDAALALAPEHPRALWYGGAAKMQAGDERTAVALWDRLLRQELPEDMRVPLAKKVEELRLKNHLPPPAPAAVATAPAAAKGVSLRILVNVTPAMLKRVHPNDTVFVYAVDPAGPPMPLAVQTFAGSNLPKLSLELNDSNSMMPTRKLSSVDRWRVVARVSPSGNAMPQPGDLEGSVELSRDKAGEPVVITIDRQRP